MCLPEMVLMSILKNKKQIFLYRLCLYNAFHLYVSPGVNAGYESLVYSRAGGCDWVNIV